MYGVSAHLTLISISPLTYLHHTNINQYICSGFEIIFALVCLCKSMSALCSFKTNFCSLIFKVYIPKLQHLDFNFLTLLFFPGMAWTVWSNSTMPGLDFLCSIFFSNWCPHVRLIKYRQTCRAQWAIATHLFVCLFFWLLFDAKCKSVKLAGGKSWIK